MPTHLLEFSEDLQQKLSWVAEETNQGLDGVLEEAIAFRLFAQNVEDQDCHIGLLDPDGEVIDTIDFTEVEDGQIDV